MLPSKVGIDVRMIGQPWTRGDQFGHFCGNRKNLAHLEPSEEAVDARCLPHESPLAAKLFDSFEPTEEEKDVSRANVPIREPALRSGFLAEGRKPSWLALESVSAEIRVEMNDGIGVLLAARQVANDFG
jgi:hypothetical protein